MSISSHGKWTYLKPLHNYATRLISLTMVIWIFGLISCFPFFRPYCLVRPPPVVNTIQIIYVTVNDWQHVGNKDYPYSTVARRICWTPRTATSSGEAVSRSFPDQTRMLHSVYADPIILNILKLGPDANFTAEWAGIPNRYSSIRQGYADVPRHKSAQKPRLIRQIRCRILWRWPNIISA